MHTYTTKKVVTLANTARYFANNYKSMGLRKVVFEWV